MKKEIRILFIISVLVVSTVFFSAISFTIQPGPTPGSFSVTVHNHHTWQTLGLYKNGAWIVNIPAGGTYSATGYLSSNYVSLRNIDALVWLHDVTLDEFWYTNAYLTFDYYGGAIVDVSAILSPEN